MQKHISIRRSAQKLAKAGQVVKALAAYEPLLSSGDADPYDHLYVGDLHERIGNRQEAIANYEAAIQAYSKLGFHRNGVALCRKIIRLDPAHHTVHRFLGDLYTADELYGDALAAYLTYLERTPADRRTSEDYRTTLGAAVTIAPRNAEMAIKLAAMLEDLDRPDDAAELLVRASEVARDHDSTRLAADLRARADAIDPGAAQRLGVGTGAASTRPAPAVAVHAEPIERSMTGSDDAEIALSAAGEEGESFVAVTRAAAPERDAAPSDDVDAFEFLVERPGGAEETDDPAEPASDSRPRRADPGSFGEIELDGGDAAEPLPASPATGARDETLPADPDTPGAEGPILEIEVDEDEGAGTDWVAASVESPAGRLANPRGATLQAIEAEQWTAAHKRVQEWIQHDPSPEAVEKLIEICQALQDNAGIVHGLILKGDLFIRDGDLPEAVKVFCEVLRRDPQNETAMRRMARFRELGVPGAVPEPLPEPGPVQAVLEARDMVIAVRDESEAPARQQQDWMEIGALLDEFREGVRQQVGDNDPQAHYDLGVSHQEMGLHEEALEEFDAALACETVPSELVLRLRELRGKCYARLERHREAIQEFRLALEMPDLQPAETAGIAYLLGLEHIAVDEIEPARACLEEALRQRPDFGEAERSLRELDSHAA